MKTLNVFKVGTHTDMSGVKVAFTEADLIASAAAYDPAIHEAPLVIGHPKHDDPAYGWVSHLTADGGSLNADPSQVNADFAEMVKQGSFKKISASFYTPDAPNNPVKGVYYLRHVGFLGATPPSIKGLRSVEYAASEDGVVCFADYTDGIIARLFRGLRDWIIDKDGLDVADKMLPDWTLNQLTEEAMRETTPAVTAYTETPPTPITEPQPNEVTNVTPEQLNQQKLALETENARLKAENDAHKALVATQAKAAAAQRHADNLLYAEGLVNDKKLTPAKKSVVVAMLDVLNTEQPLEFGEGDAKTSLVAEFKALFDNNGTALIFGEMATKDDAATAHTVSFAAPSGATVASGDLVKLAKAQAYQRQHNVTFEQAVQATENMS